ncbi:MAG: TlpA family protein disulfide reductase [Pseudobdellovibrio sp.]
MKKYISISNIFFVMVLSYLIYKKAPAALKSFKMQNQQDLILSDEVLTLKDIYNQSFSVVYPHVKIFWATWCQPCKIEMIRIQKMIDSGHIKAEQIIAISLDESKQDVLKTIKEKKYSFPIIWDDKQYFSNLYKIVGTPTILVVDYNKKIVWATEGISPSLEFRLKNYLNKQKDF